SQYFHCNHSAFQFIIASRFPNPTVSLSPSAFPKGDSPHTPSALTRKIGFCINSPQTTRKLVRLGNGASDYACNLEQLIWSVGYHVWLEGRLRVPDPCVLCKGGNLRTIPLWRVPHL